jgi:cell wall assembly regulator SMI1
VPRRNNIGFFLPLARSEKARRKVRTGFRGQGAIELWASLNECWNEEVRSSQPEWTASPKGPIEKVWWSPNWLPIFDNEQGDFLLLDLNPPKGGTVGQVIDFWRDTGPRTVFVRVFGEWLHKLADDLEQDRYEVSLDDSNNVATLMKKSEAQRQRREQEKARES